MGGRRRPGCRRRGSWYPAPLWRMANPYCMQASGGAAAAPDAFNWTYNASGEDWDGTCCTGRSQSPIAFSSGQLGELPAAARANLTFGTARGLRVFNTGRFGAAVAAGFPFCLAVGGAVAGPAPPGAVPDRLPNKLLPTVLCCPAVQVEWDQLKGSAATMPIVGAWCMGRQGGGIPHCASLLHNSRAGACPPSHWWRPLRAQALSGILPTSPAP